MAHDVIPSMVTSTMQANARLGSTSGGAQPSASRRAYEETCSVLHWRTGTMISFMRVDGPPRAGDASRFNLRRYLALSLSFREPRPNMPNTEIAQISNLAKLGLPVPKAPGFSPSLALLWARDLFYPNTERAWYEPSPKGDADLNEFMHWRLFCDHDWRPIRPPVDYAIELRRRGWLSWDEVKAGVQYAIGDPS